MKYCEKCKALIVEDADACPKCDGVLCEAENESVICLATVKGRSVSFLEPALKDAGVPCAFKNAEGEVYNSYNVAVSAESDFKLLVPFEFYTQAFNVCLSMNVVSEDDRLIEDTESDDDDKEETSETYDEAFERVNGVKKRTWKILWIVIFIVLVCLVVWGVDAVAYLISSCTGNPPPSGMGTGDFVVWH